MKKLLLALLTTLTTSTTFCMQQQLTRTDGAGPAYEPTQQTTRKLFLITNDEVRTELPANLIPVLQMPREFVSDFDQEGDLQGAEGILEMEVPFSSKYFDVFLEQARVHSSGENIAKLLEKINFEQHIACLNFADFLGAEQLYETHVSEIVRKLMQPDKLNQFLNDPSLVMQSIESVPEHVQRYIVKTLICFFPYRQTSALTNRRVLFHTQFSPDSRYIKMYYAPWNGVSRPTSTWDIHNGKYLHILMQQESHQNIPFLPQAAGPYRHYSPDGKSFATTSTLRTDSGSLAAHPVNEVTIFDTETDELQQILQIPNQDIVEAVFSPDGRLIAAALLNSRITLIWETHSGKLIRQIPGRFVVPHGYDSIQFQPARHVFSPDNKLILMRSDRSISIYDINSGRRLQTLETYSDRRSCILAQFSPDGKHVAVVTADTPSWNFYFDHHKIQLWSNERGSFKANSPNALKKILFLLTLENLKTTEQAITLNENMQKIFETLTREEQRTVVTSFLHRSTVEKIQETVPQHPVATGLTLGTATLATAGIIWWLLRK